MQYRCKVFYNYDSKNMEVEMNEWMSLLVTEGFILAKVISLGNAHMTIFMEKPNAK